MKVVDSGLVSVYDDGGERVVNARELHEFLGVGRDFSTWIKERLEEYGFVEGEDFSPKPGKTQGVGRPRIEYYLTMDCAKEVAMAENNERGRQVRRYFIEVEKRFKQTLQPLTPMQALLQSVTMLVEQEQRLAAVENRVQAIEEQRREAEESMAALPAPVSDVPAVTTRVLVNRVVRAYGIENGVEPNVLWNRLYLEFRDRHHIDLKARTTKKKGTLDVAEELGVMEDLYSLAHYLFGDRKAG